MRRPASSHPVAFFACHPSAPAPEEVSARALTPGEVIGHYRVLEQLGSGGMGSIYRARDERLEREVALKLALESIASDPEAMLREARALAALNHPNVVTVYEVGVHEGCAYIVMELLRGESLRARIERATPSLIDALSLAVDALRGLSAAHNANILHLDVRPENVFLTKEGVVKLIDFGVARQYRTGTSETENIVGTAAYMAPEQLLGDPLDFRSDLFSFGVVLHELVTGRHPFLRPQLSATMQALLNGDFFQEGSVADPDVEAIVRKCMQLEPVQRPSSAAQVLEDLERVLRVRSQLISRSSQVTYVETDHGNVAFQGIASSHSLHVLLVPGLLSRLDAWASEVEGAAFLRTLTDAGRVILFDRAGLGVSDRLSDTSLPSIDDEIEHLDAVIGASGATRVVLVALDVGAPLAAFYAAIRPERVAGLIIYAGAPGYTDAATRARLATRVEGWGTEQNASLCAPTFAQESRTTKWIASWERLTSSPKIARARIALLGHTDITPALPFITCPTLVLQRQDDPFCLPAESVAFSEVVPGAERVVLAGGDHLLFAGAQDVAPRIVRFARACGAVGAPTKDERALATWVLTDASIDVIPERFRPSVALERGAMRLAKTDRPGLIKRQLEAHMPKEAKAVIACQPRSTRAEDIFAELEPLFVETKSGRIAVTSLAQRILEGTIRSLPDLDTAPKSRKGAPVKNADRASSPNRTSDEFAAGGTNEQSPPALGSPHVPSAHSAPVMNRYALLLLAGAVLGVLGVGYFVFGRKNDKPLEIVVESAPMDAAKKPTPTISLDAAPKSEVTPAASVVPVIAASASASVGKPIAAPKPRAPAPAPKPTTTQSPRPLGTLEIKRER